MGSLVAEALSGADTEEKDSLSDMIYSPKEDWNPNQKHNKEKSTNQRTEQPQKERRNKTVLNGHLGGQMKERREPARNVKPPNNGCQQESNQTQQQTHV